MASIVELNSDQTQSRLNRLEQREWWRWTVTFIVMLALTLGLFVLSIPVIGGRDSSEQAQLSIALRGLLALVLLFDIFVIYQQVLITRLRRELATQLRVVTTLETMDVGDVAKDPKSERRRVERTRIDRRVRVSTHIDGKPACFYGRIRDISQNGMGAVIPCTLFIEEQVTLEFSLEDGHEGTLTAIVRHRQGFHYGFDFVSVPSALALDIARICSN